MRIFEKTSRLSLSLIAYYILEPKFRSGKWRMTGECKERLRRRLNGLHTSSYMQAQRFFTGLKMCPDCPGACCYGNYNRFTVFDHIGHLVSGMANPPEWGYRLYPMRSYALNRVDEGICPCLAEGQGCKISYVFRPTICIWWICDRMENIFDREQKEFIKRLRAEIEKAHWRFVLELLSRGMEKVQVIS